MLEMQMTKALSLSCCVEVYQPWSKQTLVEVAAQCLKNCPQISKSSNHHTPIVYTELAYLLPCFSSLSNTLPSLLLSVGSVNRANVPAALCVAMAAIHQSACQYASVLLDSQPFSPQSFMEFCANFHDLCKLLRTKWQKQASRYLVVTPFGCN